MFSIGVADPIVCLLITDDGYSELGYWILYIHVVRPNLGEIYRVNANLHFDSSHHGIVVHIEPNVEYMLLKL